MYLNKKKFKHLKDLAHRSVINGAITQSFDLVKTGIVISQQLEIQSEVANTLYDFDENRIYKQYYENYEWYVE